MSTAFTFSRLAAYSFVGFIILLAGPIRRPAECGSEPGTPRAKPSPLYRNSFRPVSFRKSRIAREDDSNQAGLHEQEFVSPRVKIRVDCLKESTLIRLNFTQPFSGVLGLGSLEKDRCRIVGTGKHNYMIQLSHNETGCDTKWDSAQSSITNTIIIQFHSALETGNDIVKNVMCRLKVGDFIIGRRRQPKQLSALPPKNERTAGRLATTGNSGH